MLIEAPVARDQRGAFRETYRRSAYAAAGITDQFVQANCSFSIARVLRGLHYQKHPQAQAKLVTVLDGAIFDVAVDIRRGSTSYGQWVGVELGAASGQSLFIPVGFAHGFCVLSETAHVLYQVSSEYAPELERGIRWDDPAIGIRWPVTAPLLSTKDAALPLLQDADLDETGVW
jgi:dTDP-4-dehydrorhamnose 3,5-epimerase